MAWLFAVCLVLLSFAMAVAAARPTITATADAPPTANCDKDEQDLLANCQDYVKFPADPKITPSQACCDVIHRVNVPCICSKVTPQVEQFICMDKVVYVVAYCKRPFQPGSYCGSYHVPGSLA